MAYLDADGLKAHANMPSEDIDVVLASAGGPAFVTAKLAVGTSEINGRLRKRYKTPFADPVPDVVKGWLAAIVTPEVYARRGLNPSDQTGQQFLDAAKLARDQMKEAADAEAGLYELPLLETADASGVARGGPYGYAEATPYDWMDVQADAVRGR